MNRSHFIDPQVAKKLATKIAKKEELYFKPHDVELSNIYHNRRTTSMITLYGILENGERATVLINNIYPCFYVWVDGDETQFIEKIRGILSIDSESYTSHFPRSVAEYEREKFNINPESITAGQYKKFFYFRDYNNEKWDTAIKINFYTSKQKNWAIKLMRLHGYETADEETSGEHRVLCRNYNLDYNKWASISGYALYREDRFYDKHVFIVNVDNYKVCSPEPPRLNKDKMLVMAWDIETFSEDGTFPKHENPKARIFMIGCSFHWHHSPEPLLQVCITDFPCESKDFTTIVCSSEKEILENFIKLIGSMKPDFMVAFNDGCYDWPWVFSRINQNKLATKLYKNMARSGFKVDEAKAIRHFKISKIKVEANKNVEIQNYDVYGCICIDLLIEYKKKYPTWESHKLSSILKNMNLGSKEDMPIHIMNEIYRSCAKDKEFLKENIENYTKIAKYCVIDSQRCQDLIIRGDVVYGSRATASLTYVSFRDVIYNAGGMRVKNLTFAEGKKAGFLISSIVYRSEGGLPGGHVVAPRPNLMKPKLSVVELQQTNDNWFKLTEAEVAQIYEVIRLHGVVLSSPQLEVLAADYEVLKHEFVCEFFLGEFEPPITALDFSALYPSLMMAYNISPDTVFCLNDEAAAERFKILKQRGYEFTNVEFMNSFGVRISGYTVRHNNKIDSSQPDYRFGLFPSILYLSLIHI
jgi:DNA polymerase elongation subunit (family B)